MKNISTNIFGGIEAGGTKFICAVGNSPVDIRNIVNIPTTTPEVTMGKVVDFFRSEKENISLDAIGIASFGPLDLDLNSKTFGYITDTPKNGWSNFNIVGAIRNSLNVPVALDTDVNASALSEQKWGVAQGLNNFIYITVGTGIGGGGIMNGKLMHGLVHPEIGHMRIPHNYDADPFTGSCPFHGDCLEGLASGKAMSTRWGISPERLAQNHQAWELEASYLAIGIANIVYTLSPQKIITGGGVMNNPNLLIAVRKKINNILNNYPYHSELTAGISNYIVAPGLGDQSGILGAILLAKQAGGD